MLTLEEFEEKLVKGIEDIEDQFSHQPIKPHTLRYVELEVYQLLSSIFHEFDPIDHKIIIKVHADNFGVVTIDFLNPDDPIYHYHYDGTRGEVIDYHKFTDSIELFKALTGFLYGLYSPLK